MSHFYPMAQSAVYVFNQYYFDLLKKVKDVARDMKHKADDENARSVLREIKRSYLSYDKSSGEHMKWFQENAGSLNDSLESEEFDVVEWHKSDVLGALEIYRGITLNMVSQIIRTKDVLLYYLVLLSIFSTSTLDDEKVTKLVEILKNKQFTADQLNALDNLALQRKVLMLNTIQGKVPSGSSSAPPAFRDIESTSLGKLAKEIMNEVDVDEIQKNIGEDGDIMKALGNPDSGLTKLLGTVSQKMISKIATGELKQETLLQDAMTLATSIPGMMPGGGSSGGLGDMSSMLDSIGKMASMFGGGGSGGAGDMDFGSLLQQFTGGAATKGGSSKGTRTQMNRAAVNRATQAKQLRRKLEERRKTKENIE